LFIESKKKLEKGHLNMDGNKDEDNSIGSLTNRIRNILRPGGYANGGNHTEFMNLQRQLEHARRNRGDAMTGPPPSQRLENGMDESSPLSANPVIPQPVVGGGVRVMNQGEEEEQIPQQMNQGEEEEQIPQQMNQGEEEEEVHHRPVVELFPPPPNQQRQVNLVALGAGRNIPQREQIMQRELAGRLIAQPVIPHPIPMQQQAQRRALGMVARLLREQQQQREQRQQQQGDDI
jgi:hypothetical protein